MATTINSTDLDFNNIKSALKTYLSAQSEFEDYDFEGSGLSNLLDVLAYNTHFNGLISNFALNESFLSTAQLRSSVVSHAEALGYRPRSITSAKANVNISITVPSGDPTPSSLVLPINTKFTTSVSGVSYTFQTLSPFSALPEYNSETGNTLYRFKSASGLSTTTDTAQGSVYNLEIVEGVSTTKNFLVPTSDENQIYVITDKNIDTTTLSVEVYDTSSSITSAAYSDIQDVARLTTSTKVYNIMETPNGYYELIFGNDTGLVPTAGNRIQVTYLKSNGTASNTANSFTPSAQLNVGGTNQTLSVTLNSQAAGGAARQSIESIRNLAPLMYSSQQRLVTADDYRTLILAKYPGSVRDVNAYGGEQASPRKYGVVYVVVNFYDNVSTESQSTIKNNIISDLTDNLSILTVNTEFVDPQRVHLELTTTYNLNPSLTNNSSAAVESNITATITNYFTDNLETFNKIFRRSNLLTQIDALDDAILNTKIDVKAQLRLSTTTTPSLTLGTSRTYTLNFPFFIASPDDEFYRVTSTRFTFNNKTCTVRNRLSSNILEIVSSDGIEVTNAGSYTTGGEIKLEGFAPSAFEGDFIKISIVPANQNTIKPLLNFIIEQDEEISTVITQIDYEDIRVTL